MPSLYLPKSESYVHFVHPLEDAKQYLNPIASLSLSAASAKTTSLHHLNNLKIANIGSKPWRPFFEYVLLLERLSFGCQYLPLLTILAFPMVLDDMETSRLASLHELSLRGTQLVVAVVIDRSSGNTSIESHTMEISLNFGSSTLTFIRALAAPKVRSP
ncbi:hypothetical protein Tco_0637515 [Tanacetum coccineum]